MSRPKKQFGNILGLIKETKTTKDPASTLNLETESKTQYFGLKLKTQTKNTFIHNGKVGKGQFIYMIIADTHVICQCNKIYCD